MSSTKEKLGKAASDKAISRNIGREISRSLTEDDKAYAFVAMVGQQIRQARKQRAMSRRELSEASGVSQRYLAQLEGGNGNISIALLFRIAQALGHSPQWLLGGVERQDPQLARLIQYFTDASPERRKQALEILQPIGQDDGKANRICLIGLRGAGKSTLGRLLAEDICMDFVELNRLVEEQSGMPVDEVMALYGQEGFRQLEREALETVTGSRMSVVLAVGGGIVSENDTFEKIRRSYHTIWLRASPQEHMDRVRQQGDHRPMAGNPRAMDELKSILTSREALYALADATVDTSNRGLEQSRRDLLSVARTCLTGNQTSQ